MMGYGFDLWGGGGWMLLFWVAMIALAVWGLKLLFSGGQSRQVVVVESALEIAGCRYSRGEISREEYLALLEDLQRAEGVSYEKPKRRQR